MKASASSPSRSSFSSAVPGTAALFFIQIFATLGFAVLYESSTKSGVNQAAFARNLGDATSGTQPSLLGLALWVRGMVL